jgi:hypothetical protein
METFATAPSSPALPLSIRAELGVDLSCVKVVLGNPMRQHSIYCLLCAIDV